VSIFASAAGNPRKKKCRAEESRMARSVGMMRIAAAMLAATAFATSAAAADHLRIGKSPSFAFAYVPLEIAKSQGMLQKEGIEIETIAFEGAAKMDLGMTSGSVDIILGSPSDMAAMAKGMPAKAVAVIAQPVRELAILVPYDSPLKSIKELKGKSVGIATVGSITQWAALELARSQGWKPEDINLVSISSSPNAAAVAMRTHQVDADVGNLMTGVVLEKQKVARVLALASDYANTFIMHEMSASDALMETNPDAIRRFIKAWFAAVAYMRDHKAETVAAAMPVTGLSAENENQEYDLLMPEITSDGKHEPSMMQRVADSFIELKLLDQRPDIDKLYTNKFLPN
jgi:NitT/TauT family transport system substrate-binding protein